MTRALWIQARRSTAPVVLLLLLAACLIAMFADSPFWSGGWLMLASGQRLLLVLLWPIALALGAWQMRWEQRAQVDELFATTGRPRWHRIVVTAAVLGVAAFTSYLLAFAAGAAWIAGGATYFPAAVPAVVAIGGLSLVAAVWLGMGVGYLVPHLVTAPALAVVGFAVQVLLGVIFKNARWLADLLSPMMSAPWDPYYTLPASFTVGQTLWLVGLALTGLLLVAPASKRFRPAAIVPVLLGAGLAVALSPRVDTANAQWVRDLAGAELVCAEGTPRVCVTRVNAKVLPAATPLAREVLAKLADLPDAPTSAVEDWHLPYGDARDVSTGRPGPDTLTFLVERSGELVQEKFVLDTLTTFISQGRYDCDAWTEEQQTANGAALAAAVYWFAGKTPAAGLFVDPAEVDQATRLATELGSMPRDQAVQRVAAVRAGVKECRTDLTAILQGRAK
ncbi:hypothetical protein [Actinoplanes sp. NPDC051859]|uniref:hypothetical protein n=1 Tax=Actinoplanes sp. NPDC051859 TaxID=3363909 RepID=UPI0037996989